MIPDSTFDDHNEDLRILSGIVPVPKGNFSTARIPLIYKDAVKALAQCSSIDEAKFYADKADALAAWARIYIDDAAMIEAQRLKLHAYRRMALLADEIMLDWRLSKGLSTASVPRVLRDHGIKQSQAQVIAKVGELDKARFDAAVKQKRPPSPTTLVFVDAARQPQWERIKRSLSSALSLTEGVDEVALVKSMSENDKDRAHSLALDVGSFCFMLTQALENEALPTKVSS